MKSLLVQLDEPAYRALDRVVPAAKRKRAEFIRAAIRKAIIEAEEPRTRRAYREQPDLGSEADDWLNAEKWAQ
jgi:metal-responsive CopG/Arc/MetJ family transcriptional regulator